MKSACILTIGSEIVEGVISNENSRYLSRRLLELGYYIKRIVSVDDVLEDLISEVSNSLKECDLLITTGGLGPTEDDLTREAVSSATGVPLVFDEDLYERISERVKDFAGKVVESIRKEAMVLKGAKVIWNDVGSAPGQLLEIGGKTILLLPGPPIEMKNVFEKVAEELRAGEGFIIKTLKFFGVRESVLEDELKDVIYSNPDVKVATQASYTEGVWIRFKAPKALENELNGILEEIKKIKGKDIYAEDDGSMEETVVRLLSEKGKKLSLAESCTGGMISSMIVNVPGASKVYKGGIIAYDKLVKEKLLGVRRSTLERFGSVSGECAIEMAEGAHGVLGGDFTISITGVAGPSSEEGKPVGLVYFDVYDGKHRVFERRFKGERNTIRRRAAMEALDVLRRILGGMIG